MRLIEFIEQLEVTRRTLCHLEHPLDVPAPTPDRAPRELATAARKLVILPAVWQARTTRAVIGGGASHAPRRRANPRLRCPMLPLVPLIPGFALILSSVVQFAPGAQSDVVAADETLRRAFVRSLEIIGEAEKKVPEDFRAACPAVEWRAMAGMRDRLIHDCFRVDFEPVWDVVRTRIPGPRRQPASILEG